MPPQARRRRKKLFVTGSSGLIGSEAVSFFDEDGWSVFGVDNNLRRYFFGADGDTRAVLARLKKSARHFEHYDLDIRDRGQIKELLKKIKPDLIIHCAAQPSHDLASRLPFVDFEVNAGGTLNLLEGARLHCPETPFIFMSTNKVYGDAPNELPMVELETRYDYAREVDYAGINESCRIDRCMHSLFGASKVAADV
ncbi:MAG: NAD-dependent epimerase/dehydratase family protein, partial [Candidatus Omnitrophica bacterium]|nr:NAD-dependent epimerase/dehydratase family protein [Candidatus Omnitrophota bacterium]